MADTKTVTIFGASGRVGVRTVEAAMARGWTVRAVEPQKIDNLPDGVEMHIADVLNDDLGPCITGADYVVSCLGVGNAPATLASPPPLYTTGTARIVRSMQAAKIDRIAVVSASFVETFERGPASFRATLPALTRVFHQMEEMERTLNAYNWLKWTAVRPGWIMDAPASETPVITENVIPEDLIRSRTGDIANLIISTLADGTWIRGKPAVASHEEADSTSLKAVVSEIL